LLAGTSFADLGGRFGGINEFIGGCPPVVPSFYNNLWGIKNNLNPLFGKLQ
jgi:hypothetical protein